MAVLSNEGKQKPLNPGIFVTSIVFGISSWVVFSGIWVEAPLLIEKLPEGWKLPSMIGAVSQLAQVGPVLLFLLKCKCVACLRGSCAKQLRRRRVSDRVIIYGLFLIGLVAAVTLALFWDRTALLLGQVRSAAFFTCVFCLAILDCTCTIVFLTYVGKLRGNYITGLYIGEGISSLLPSLFALLQGMGGDTAQTESCGDALQPLNSTNANVNVNVNALSAVNTTASGGARREPRFSISAYFWLLCATILVSFLAFLVLEFWPSFQKEKVSRYSKVATDEMLPSSSDATCQRGTERCVQTNVERDAGRDETVDYNSEDCEQTPTEPTDQDEAMKRSPSKKQQRCLDLGLLLAAITLVSFVLYGIVPGLSSYSTLPFGKDIMHLSVTLALITQPISSLVATFVQLRSTRSIYVVLIVAMIAPIHVVVSSLMSPCPPFLNSLYGRHLMVLSWICSFSLLMYLRCCITVSLKQKHGEKSLVWCGLFTQFGQFFGSILIYLLIDFTEIFQEANMCNQYSCK